MKKYRVYVYYWPAEANSKELWLGYTTYDNRESKSFKGIYVVEAASRARAITKAIKEAKLKVIR